MLEVVAFVPHFETCFSSFSCFAPLSGYCCRPSLAFLFFFSTLSFSITIILYFPAVAGFFFSLCFPAKISAAFTAVLFCNINCYYVKFAAAGKWGEKKSSERSKRHTNNKSSLTRSMRGKIMENCVRFHWALRCVIMHDLSVKEVDFRLRLFAYIMRKNYF